MAITGPSSSVWLPVFAFGLVPGPRELVLVIIVALVLYGRSGVRVIQAARSGQPMNPWLKLVRTALVPSRSGQSRPQARPARGQGRFFWALALIAAVGVAAWVAARAVMHAAASGPLSP